jgi:hypothetical protein
VGFGVVALVAGGGALWLVSDRPAEGGRRALSAREARVVLALAEAYFPLGNPLGVSVVDIDIVSGADAYIAGLLQKEQRLIRALLTAFDQWPRVSLSSTRTFSSLPLAERIDVLRTFEGSPVMERRLIASLFRALVGMPFFEHPLALASIGYAPGCAL